MGPDEFGRLDAKLDLILERLEKLETEISAASHRQLRPPALSRPLTDDPKLARRLRERLEYRRANPRSDDLAREVAKVRAEHGGDPDWWLRYLLDQMDENDPIPVDPRTR